MIFSIFHLKIFKKCENRMNLKKMYGKLAFSCKFLENQAKTLKKTWKIRISQGNHNFSLKS